MDRPDEASATTRTTYERESHTRWAHRNLGGAWWLALLVVPLLLAALVSAAKAGDIENDLGARSTAALSEAGLNGVDLDFSGRDAAVSAAAGASLSEADLERARSIVADIEGVRVAVIDTTGPTADGADEPSASAQRQIAQILGADKIVSVRAGLVDAGVAAGTIIRVVGARDSQPLGDNATPEGRAMNRYADIVVE